MAFPQFFGDLTKAPRRRAASGEKANFSGSFFQAGNVVFSFGIAEMQNLPKIPSSQIKHAASFGGMPRRERIKAACFGLDFFRHAAQNLYGFLVFLLKSHFAPHCGQFPIATC